MHDGCNQGLKRLDQEFCDYLPIRNAKVYGGVPGKDGRIRSLFSEAGSGTNLFRHAFDAARNHIEIRIPASALVKDGNRLSFSFPTLKSDQWKLTRAVHKIALGLLSFTHGNEVALNRCFDQARRYVKAPPGRQWRYHAERPPRRPLTLTGFQSPDVAWLQFVTHPNSGFVYFSYFENEFLVNLAADLREYISAGEDFLRAVTGDHRPLTIVPGGTPLQWNVVGV